MKKLFAILALSSALIVTAACNTVRGAGRDRGHALRGCAHQPPLVGRQDAPHQRPHHEQQHHEPEQAHHGELDRPHDVVLGRLERCHPAGRLLDRRGGRFGKAQVHDFDLVAAGDGVAVFERHAGESGSLLGSPGCRKCHGLIARERVRRGVCGQVHIFHLGHELEVLALDEDLIARAGAIDVVHDWFDVTGYDAEVRQKMTPWAIRTRAQHRAIHIGTSAGLVRMGVTMVRLATGAPIRAYESRAALEVALADTIAKRAS